MAISTGSTLVTSAYHTFLSLFTYNKANFLYDRNQRVNRVFTGISYKLQEFGLYRQDIRDLTGLTTNTTTQYHLVTVLELGMCVTLLGPARLPEDVPEWVLWHQHVALVNSFMLLACSMWLATRAAITAESLNVRLQTQYVRLPFPDAKTLDSALTKAEEFEGANLSDMVRIPFANSTVGRLMGSEAEESPDKKKKKRIRRKGTVVNNLARDGLEGPRPLVSESHLVLYRQLQKHWQGFDAYARVTMSVGTYWLILSLAYYKIGWTLCHHRAGLVAGGTAALFASSVVLLTYMDLHINRLELALTCCLVYAGPVLVGIGAARIPSVDHVTTSTSWEAVGAGMAHAFFTLWMWYLGLTVPGEVELPTRFLGVQYLDIFSPMISEIRKHLGGTPMHSALGSLENTRNGLRRKWQGFRGIDLTVGSSSTKRMENIRARVASAVRESGSVKLAASIQQLGDALWLASSAGVLDSDPEMQQAQCLLKRLEVLVKLRGMHRTLQRWSRDSIHPLLGTAQASQLQSLREDVDLRISQLESCTGRSGGASSSASEADVEGCAGPPNQKRTQLGSNVGTEYELSEDPSAEELAVKFNRVIQRCEELFPQADGLIFNASSTLKGESIATGVLTKQSSKISLDSLISECSSKSSISHLANLVQHATEPLHGRYEENNFYRTLAMDMPMRMYHLLCGVMLLVWCTGAGVHFTRIDGGLEPWYVTPRRQLSEVSPGAFLGRRSDTRADVAGSRLSVTWPGQFFRPSSLHCLEDSNGQPQQIIASNNFLVFQIGSGQDKLPRQLHCPVSRHDSIVGADCKEGGACSATVVAGGMLYKCSTGLSSRGGPEFLEPFAAMPPEWVQGQGTPALQAWVAADNNMTRIFAAPEHGPIMELRRFGSLLQPVAELVLPQGMLASSVWRSLSIQSDKLFAVTKNSPSAYAWSLTTGEELGSWHLPAFPSTVWCINGGNSAQELVGLSTTPLTPQAATYVRASMPTKVSAL